MAEKTEDAAIPFPFFPENNAGKPRGSLRQALASLPA
jgi:hypothetical protein